MSESNVQPTQSLSEWLISRLTAHYETSDAPTTDLHASFDGAFAANAEFVVNHSPVSRDAYKKRLEERLLVASSSVEWKDVMEIPEEGDSGTSQKSGIVAGFLVITRSSQLRIRAGPAQNLTYVTFSAKIASDPGAGGDDSRRIVQLFESSITKAAPVVLNLPTT